MFNTTLPLANQAGSLSEFLFSMSLPLGLLLVFYVLLWRPMKKADQERARSLIAGLKKNDKVLTHAGIYGTIVSVSDKENEVVVKVDDNVRLKMVKESIARNISNEEAARQASEKDKAASAAS